MKPQRFSATKIISTPRNSPAKNNYNLFLFFLIFFFISKYIGKQSGLGFFFFFFFFFLGGGGGRVVRWSWVNFQCRGVLLVWIRVGQGPTALAVGAGGGCLDIFILIYPFSSLSPSLWETTRYRLKYCLKGSLSPKTTKQPIFF